MNHIPRLDKKIVKLTSLDDIEAEKRCRMTKNPLERIEAVEYSFSSAGVLAFSCQIAILLRKTRSKCVKEMGHDR